MKTVYIGTKYKPAFDSIFALCKHNYVPSKIKSVDPASQTIVCNDTAFVLDTVDVEKKEQSFVMEKNGASWFSSIRDRAEIDGGSSEWLALIHDVAMEYRIRNFFLTFKQQKRSVDAERIEKMRKNVESFFRKFFYDYNETPRVNYVPSDRTADIDVYAVNLVMDVNSGAGDTRKILGKVYFKDVKTGYKLLDRAQGEEIENQINAIIETDKFGSHEPDPNSKSPYEVINEILKQIDSEIQSENVKGAGDADEDRVSFSDSVIISCEKDRKIIDGYRNNVQEIVSLNCLRMNVIGIYHIKWSNLSYRVELNSSPLLNVQVTSNGRMTVSCARCPNEKDAVLMVDDVIEYEEKGQKKQVRIDVSKKDLGLANVKLEDVRANSNFGRHLLRIVCPDVGLPGRKIPSCVRTVCARDSFLASDGYRYCRGCEHPDKVCEDFNREPKLTSTMEYASDVRALVFGDRKLNRCAICGRAFRDRFPSGSATCPLCGKVGSDRKPEEIENVYAGYSDLFPIWFRWLVKKSASAAVEDAEMIVFRVRMRLSGRDRYYLSDKLDLQKTGYLSGPKRIHISEGRIK